MPRHKTVTAAQQRKLDALREAVELAMRDVWDSAPPGARFNVALQVAPNAVSQRYVDARAAEWIYEDGLVADGRGWRDERWTFRAY